MPIDTVPFSKPALAHLRPFVEHGIVQFPVYAMRGGTSTGAVLWNAHVPAQSELRDELIRHIMGVPLHGVADGNRQIGGLGRGVPTSNKVFLVDVDSDGARMTSTLAQLAASKSEIDWSVNCGNMSAALPLYAIDTGLVAAPADNDTYTIKIYNTNTASRMTGQLRIVDGGVPAEVEIPGVLGRYPGVDLYLHDPVGAKTGALLPTGKPCDLIGDGHVSCIDVAVPMVIVCATELGKTGYETPAALEADPAFKETLRALWVAAGLRMGLKSRSGEYLSATQLAESETIPKICMIAPAREAADLAVRYFTPQAAHPSLAVSGACCVAAACLVPGTVAHSMASLKYELTPATQSLKICIENPAGILETRIDAALQDGQVTIRRAAYRRSAQVLMRGHLPLYQASQALSRYFEA
jgi:4-oxalomesaconate tautomerase